MPDRRVRQKRQSPRVARRRARKSVGAGSGLADPSQVAPTALQAWYDASNIGQALAHNDAVSQWNDLSINADHLVQGTAANKPTYITNAVNGKPVVRFDGTADFLAVTGSLTGLTAGHIFVVANRTTSTVSIRYWVDTGGGIGDTAWALISNDTAADRAVYFMDNGAGTAQLNVATPGTGYAVWAAEIENGVASSAILHKNGTLAGNITGTPAIAPDDLHLGAQVGGATRYFDSDIAEVVIYNRRLSSAERVSVERYLGAKYAIAVA